MYKLPVVTWVNRWRSCSKNESERKKKKTRLQNCQIFSNHICVSDLEILPLIVLVLITVCDDDSWIVSSSGQTLVILHQLVGIIYTEQLHTDKNTRMDLKIKQNQTKNIPRGAVSLPGCHPSCGKVLFPHFPHWYAPYCQCSNWNPNPGSTHITRSRTWHNDIIKFVRLSLCVCRYWPPPIPHSLEAKGNAAGYHRLFPPWTTWSSCIYVPPWQQDSHFNCITSSFSYFKRETSEKRGRTEGYFCSVTRRKGKECTRMSWQLTVTALLRRDVQETVGNFTWISSAHWCLHRPEWVFQGEWHKSSPYIHPTTLPPLSHSSVYTQSSFLG